MMMGKGGDHGPQNINWELKLDWLHDKSIWYEESVKGETPTHHCPKPKIYFLEYLIGIP